MHEYIERHVAIIEMMDNDVDHVQGMDGREVVQILEDIPVADVVPVAHGQWIRGKYTDDDLRYNDYSYRCNRCGKIVDFEENYCPNCGAKMDGGENT